MYRMMLLGVAMTFAAGSAVAQEGGLAEAQAVVANFSKPNPPWDGPTEGPNAEAGKLVVYVSTDQRNGGARGVGEGVVEAAEAVGWEVRVLDGQGTVSGRVSALNQAIALNPDVIVLGGVDAAEQAAVIEGAAQAGIVVVGWHSTSQAGPHPDLHIFTDITTEPLDVAKAAAAFAITDSDGDAGVIIFTDSVYSVAIAKSDAMAAVIEACETCTLLEVVDTPLSDTATRMSSLSSSLLTRYGDQWTHSLSINDLTFDFMGPALASAGIAGDGRPRNISAGDGSDAAFQRIREQQYQIGTVAEPLRLQGWQIVDEANRALNGEPDSGYVAPPHLFMLDNIAHDGGENNIYDPQNGYEDIYKSIWGVQ